MHPFYRLRNAAVALFTLFALSVPASALTAILSGAVTIAHAKEQGASALSLRHVRTLKNNFAVTVLAWHPDGRQLAVGQVLEGRIIIWGAHDGRRIQEINERSGTVKSLAYSPDGKYLAVGRGFTRLTTDHVHAHLYEVVTGKLVHRFIPPYTQPKGGSNDAQAIAFSPDSRFFVVSGYGAVMNAVVYDIATGKVAQPLSAPTPRPDAIQTLSFSPDGRFLAVGRISGALEMWATDTWKLVKNIQTNLPSVSSLAFSPNSRYLATGTFIGQRKDSKSGQVITGSFSDDISIWEIPSLNRVKSYGSKQGGGYIKSLFFNKEGNRLWAGGAGKSIDMVDIPSGKTTTLIGDFPQVAYPSFSKNRKLLAVGAGQEIQIYEVRN